MNDFGDGRWLKGIKPHRCAGCHAVIPKGEEHFQFKGMWQGDWQNWRLHAECHESWEQDGCDELTDMPVPERLMKEQPHAK